MAIRQVKDSTRAAALAGFQGAKMRGGQGHMNQKCLNQVIKGTKQSFSYTSSFLV